jgi:hypothetical protein
MTPVPNIVKVLAIAMWVILSWLVFMFISGLLAWAAVSVWTDALKLLHGAH